MAKNVSFQQQIDIKSCHDISICLDAHGSARLIIFVRNFVLKNDSTVTTDGARSFTVQENGFINVLIKYIFHSILVFHCTIQLCARTGLKMLDEFMRNRNAIN